MSTADLSRAVVESAEAAGLHAPVPTLILELQTLVGAMAANAIGATNRGRTPFRPDEQWSSRLGDLAYGVFLIADQSGVDLDSAVLRRADLLHRQAQARAAQEQAGWPFEER